MLAVAVSRRTLGHRIFGEYDVVTGEHIPMTVAEDIFFFASERNIKLTAGVVIARARWLSFKYIKKNRFALFGNSYDLYNQDDRYNGMAGVQVKTGHYTSIDVLKKREAAKRMCMAGATYKEIASVIGISQRYARNLCTDAGVTSKRWQTAKERKALVLQLREHGMTFREISEQLGISLRWAQHIAAAGI